jgi:hypothetical protein
LAVRVIRVLLLQVITELYSGPRQVSKNMCKNSNSDYNKMQKISKKQILKTWNRFTNVNKKYRKYNYMRIVLN